MNSGQITAQFSPKLDLPYRYLLTGLGFLPAGVLYLLFSPGSLTGDYIRSRDTLILVHTFGLGFITSIMMGAMYQLLPVVLQKPLFSEFLGKFNYWIYLSGIGGMLLSFFYDFNKINITGGLLAISLLVFVLNAVITIFSSGKKDIIVAHVLVGVLSLFLVLVLGAIMSENIIRGIFSDPMALIKIHLILALFGWIIITTMGFSYKLIPMFMLSHGYPEHYSKISFYTLVSGIFIFSIAQFSEKLQEVEKIAFIFISAGVLFHLLQIRAIFKKRLRKRIEPQIFATILGEISLLTGILLIPAVSDNNYSRHYTPFIFLLPGFAGLYVLGMMHKIVPFLEWYNRYSSRIGREKVPLTKDMIDESLISPTVYLWVGGIIAIALGSWFSEELVIRFGALSMLFSTILFLFNILNVFRK